MDERGEEKACTGPGIVCVVVWFDSKNSDEVDSEEASQTKAPAAAVLIRSKRTTYVTLDWCHGRSRGPPATLVLVDVQP